MLFRLPFSDPLLNRLNFLILENGCTRGKYQNAGYDKVASQENRELPVQLARALYKSRTSVKA